MSERAAPLRQTEPYDCVVIGAGLAGLCTGALLAKAGQRVLVCERQARPGGCCTSFWRKGYRFDVSVQSYSGCRPDGAIGSVLRALGVENEIEFRQLDPAREYLFPDRTVTLPASLEDYREHLVEQFPGESEGITDYLDLQRRVFGEIARLPLEIAFSEVSRFDQEFPLLSAYRRATLAEVLSAHVGDPHLKTILAVRSSYLILPPSRSSFIAVSNMEMNYFFHGVCVARGGAQALTDVLVGGLKRHGGELAVRTEITRIRREGYHVTGVETASGESIAARRVVLAAATGEAVLGMLDPPLDAKHPFVRRLGALQTSHSYFIAFWGIAADDPGGSPVGNKEVFEDYDLEREYASLSAGKIDPRAPCFLLVPSLVDRDAVPRRRGQTVCASVKAPYAFQEGWDRRQRERLAQRLFERARRCLPRLAGNDVEVAETVTPETIERWTGNLKGSPYGWAHVPGQVGLDRPGPNTPLRNFHLAGHWTRPGGGVASVFVSAKSLVERLLSRGAGPVGA